MFCRKILLLMLKKHTQDYRLPSRKQRKRDIDLELAVVVTWLLRIVLTKKPSCLAVIPVQQMK
jgi:hypothetical protein